MDKRAHVLVAVDEQGRTVGTRAVANTPEGWATALQRAREQQQPTRWGVEHRGSLGKGLAQFLLAQGEADVREVVPHRTAQDRRRGLCWLVGASGVIFWHSQPTSVT